MPDSLPDETIAAIRDALLAGRKIEAVRLCRQASGLGLREAKEMVDGLQAELRAAHPDRFPTRTRSGCGVAMVLVALICVVVSYWLVFR